MKSFTIEGMIPPLVAPFGPDEEIDEGALRAEVRYLLSAGVDGLSTGGSTGEGALLSDAELSRCLEIALEESPAGRAVIAGIIRNSTRDAVRAARRAAEAGAEALLVTPVSYYGATPAGNREYYARIAGEAGLPVVVYNVVAKNLISPQEFVELLSVDGVVGIKQVDPVGLSELCVLTAGRGATVFSAADHLLYGTYVSGARGAISALVTIAPRLCVEQWQAFRAGEQAKAMELHSRLAPIVRTYLTPPFPGKVKALLELQGRRVGAARSPDLGPTEEERSAMGAALRGAGLL